MEYQPTNNAIADLLIQIADLIAAQDGNPHRIRAYRKGAVRVRNHDEPIARLVSKGKEETLLELPDIGEGLIRVISGFVETGRSELLDRLQGDISPEKVFARVPGIGKILGERIANKLDIETLQELEQAAYDGRLAEIEGFGQQLVRNVQVSLAGMLSRAAQPRVPEAFDTETAHPDPDVSTLLALDQEYRTKAAKDKLKRIAPKRFNPEGKAWLPIMHISRNGWHFTVLFSNTKRAHELKKTHDWVVIYYEKEEFEGQATVVTASYGKLSGKRIVRGREEASEQFYLDE